MKLTILAILGLIFIGTVRLAQFIAACFCILFFGYTTYELLCTFRHPGRIQRAA